MKALVLAAGFGTRLRPLTYTIPKPLIKIKGRENILNIIDKIENAGIKDIFINVHHLREKIIDFINSCHLKNLNIEFLIEEEILGTAGPVKTVSVKMRNKADDLLVMNSDIIFDLNLREVINFHRKNENNVTLAYFPDENGKDLGFDDQGRLVKFTDLILHQEIKKRGTFAGIYIFSFDSLMSLGNLMEENKYYEFVNVFKKFLNIYKIDVYGFRIESGWLDFGKSMDALQDVQG